MNEVFDRYARYYDALYRDKNYAAEAMYLASLLKHHSLIPATNILEFGAGSGKLQREFEHLGFEVVSVDSSAEMVEQARKAGVTVQIGDIRTHRLVRKFDAVVAYFHVVSYLSSDRDVDMGISNALHHLERGGVFIFDIWFSEAVLAQKPEIRVKRVIDNGAEIIRIAEPFAGPSLNTVEVRYQVFAEPAGESLFETISERHLLRHFSENEISKIVERHGATVVAFEETVTKSRPGADTWGVTVVARLENQE
jgi:SAM-dependent methyltransferase